MSEKPRTLHMTPEALDVEELEHRLELAAQTAACSCCGSNGNTCDCNTKVKAGTATGGGAGC